jgi:hypothetical protein
VNDRNISALAPLKGGYDYLYRRDKRTACSRALFPVQNIRLLVGQGAKRISTDQSL